MLREKLSALLRSCIAQKARDLPSWQIPLDVYVSPCFSRSGKQTSSRLPGATREQGAPFLLQMRRKRGAPRSAARCCRTQMAARVGGTSAL
jgi:hypothetical protein